MKFWRCKKCCFLCCLEDDEIPYCPACDCEDLEEIFENEKYNNEEKKEEHHIHPKFMDNPKGLGQQYLISKKQHDVLHGKIMVWLWNEIPTEKRKEVIKLIIKKSMKEIGV